MGADHRGFELKGRIKEYFLKKNVSFEDVGNKEYDEDDDYPFFAKIVAKKVLEREDNKGILICGSGIGMDISANRFKGIRAGLSFSSEMAMAGRSDDDINILVLAADFIDSEKAILIIDKFLETDFKEEEKYKRRISALDNLE
jgi:ribose 5-phosphate isomerase B